jgi:hypothetical protein
MLKEKGKKERRKERKKLTRPRLKPPALKISLKGLYNSSSTLFEYTSKLW